MNQLSITQIKCSHCKEDIDTTMLIPAEYVVSALKLLLSERSSHQELIDVFEQLNPGHAVSDYLSAVEQDFRLAIDSRGGTTKPKSPRTRI